MTARLVSADMVHTSEDGERVHGWQPQVVLLQEEGLTRTVGSDWDLEKSLSSGVVIIELP